MPAEPRSPRSIASALPNTNTPALKPRTAVAVWVICADSDEEARRLAASGRMTFTLLRRGELIAVPPPEKALEFLASDEPHAGPAAL